MSISALLQAAEYLDKRDKDHVYCSAEMDETASDSGSSSNRSPLGKEMAASWAASTSKSRQRKASTGERVSHNELEKSRRAHLRNCLEKLRELVPISESARHTTLGLLTRGRLFIQALEERDRRCMIHKESLYNKQRVLKRRLAELSYELRQNLPVPPKGDSGRRLPVATEVPRESTSEPANINDLEVEVEVELKTESYYEDYESAKASSSSRRAPKGTIAKTLTFDEEE